MGFIIFTSQEIILLLLLLLFSSFYMFQENFISTILLRQDLKKKLASSSTYSPTIFQHRIHPPENGIWLYNCVTKKSDYMYVFIHKIQPSHCIFVSVFVKVYK